MKGKEGRGASDVCKGRAVLKEQAGRRAGKERKGWKSKRMCAYKEGGKESKRMGGSREFVNEKGC